jgi:hypothetical protein
VRISAVWVDRGTGGRAPSDDAGFVSGDFAGFAVFVLFVGFAVFVEPRFRVAMR